MKQISIAAVWALGVIALAAVAIPAAVKAQAPSSAFSACLTIDDMTKERLDCFDKIIAPAPIQALQPVAPKSVNDCRYLKEQDARLKCYDRFVSAKPAPAAAPKRATKVQ